jgi:hypothetical protein
MTGFKEGASDSPFDESDDDEDAHADSATTAAGAPETTPEPTDSRDTGEVTGGSQGGTSGDRTETSIPWVLARDSVHAQRSARQVHLQDDTLTREREFRNTVERALNETVELTDLREAALLVAMDHPEEVADKLREWGYDYGK